MTFFISKQSASSNNGQAAEVGQPSALAKAKTMAQMFRAVKCDSKRSQSDWQEEYANRKRARIEEDRKVSQKQASGRTDEQMTVWHVDAYKLTEQ